MINEHIDLQCKNFERGNSSAASASNNVVPSIQLSPRRNPKTSPELDPRKEEEAKETKSSPYFKKCNFQQAPREISSKTVVRTIDLGSLSGRLSRRHRQEILTEDKHEDNHEKANSLLDFPSSSQKGNIPVQSLDDKGDSVTIIPLTTTSTETSPCASPNLLCLVETSQPVTISKLTKRKKETTHSGKVSNLGKKAKYERRSGETEMVLPSEDAPDSMEVPSTTNFDPISISDETGNTSSAATSSDLLAGPEKTNSDQAVETSPQLQLPYYLRNFQTVLQAVLENKDDRALFNQDDMSCVNAFEKLSGMLKYNFVIINLKLFKCCISYMYFSLFKSWDRNCM